MKHDIEIDIATASSCMARKFRNRRWKWADFTAKCSVPVRTGETMAEYRRMDKEAQLRIKDTGGFVGGYLNDGVRKKGSVRHRTLLTLDLDYANHDMWEEFTMTYSCAAMCYSTHKHTPESPRLRLVIPLSRNVDTVEYEAIGRRVMESIGIDQADHTTYDPSRIMFFGSVSSDGEWVFETQDGPPLDADAVLATYTDFRDASEWPVGSRETDTMRRSVDKAEDPTQKRGLIGAFCRAYTIEEAIETLLHDEYVPTALPGRYTYAKGSVAGGLVCYDGKFAYSHHETDPAGGRLCNAFDLVRIHRYGQLDEGSRVQEPTKMPSYRRMTETAAGDRRVRLQLARERRDSARSDFEGIEPEEEQAEGTDDDWMADLEVTQSGAYRNSMHNIETVLEKDPAFKGKLWRNEFTGFDDVVGGLPWNPKARTWGNSDDANLRVYMEKKLGITGKERIRDGLEAVLTRHRRHPVREYLENLRWDGTPRLDTLIIDWLGAHDTALTRQQTRKFFTAAVARVMRPGCKFDYCLILAGPEGIGKSTLLSVMAGEWFNDSLITMEGKTGMEQIRQGWVFELSELSGMKRSEVEQVKAFVSRQEDIFRPAYGVKTERYPRQCVFAGTTNEMKFLKGDTGNRRFWPVAVGETPPREGCTLETLREARDQLWAEARQRWKDGERLYLDSEMERAARIVQTSFNDDSDDPMRELLHHFLYMKLPPDWNTWSLVRRRAFLHDPDPLDPDATEDRTHFCTAEFVCEMLRTDMSTPDYKYKARKVNKLMAAEPEWEPKTTVNHVLGLYGRHRGWVRKFYNETQQND